MPLPNIINELFTGIGDHTVRSGVPDHQIRVRQLNVQNKDAAVSTEIVVKTPNETIFGPITLGPLALLNLELPSEEPEHIMMLEKNTDLVVESSANVSILVFGWAELF